MEWILVLITTYRNIPVVIPHKYPTEEVCLKASAYAATQTGRNYPMIGVCVPATTKGNLK